MKRPALVLVFAITLCVTVAVLALRGAVAPERIRNEVEQTLSAWIGTTVSFSGTANVEILPRPRVVWSGVTIAGVGSSDIGTAKELRVVLSFFDLLRGRIRPAGVSLDEPNLALATLPTIDLSQYEARLRSLPPLHIAVSNGRVRLAGDGDTASVEGLSLELDWPTGDERASIESKLSWRGLPVGLAVQGPTSDELATEVPTRIAAELAIAGSAVGFRGTFQSGVDRRLQGQVSLTAPDPSDLLRRLDRADLASYFAGNLLIVGDLNAGTDDATFSLTRAEIGSTRLDGALSMRWSGDSPTLAATLAADTIDLRDGRPALFGPGWSTLPLDRLKDAMGLDLRVSTKRLLYRSLQLERLAATLHFGEGRINAEVGVGNALGASLSLMARGEVDEEGLRVGLRSELRDLPLAEVARTLGATGVEDGRANATFTAETRCTVPRECPSRIDGRLAVAVKDAALMGGSPLADVSRFHPVALSAASTQKKTNWSRSDLDLHLVGSNLTIDSLVMVGDLATLDLGGTGDLATGRLDLTGRATFPTIRLDPDRNPTRALTVPLRIQGPIDRLELVPGTTTGADN